ncbi:hypothetical protein OV208_30275 [Corallococcus sp. bb12-1]|uniref:hypothetical protein n=1 Tax=Corallococcus sp. bb12-1 TaxID=2996784 RepID=UPI0022707E5D|nr:hypothetical protein [Corallococcus sp. bb12-1]MCY1045641.1 hypothetical protein [Corallococcus sp. bb12-1]
MTKRQKKLLLMALVFTFFQGCSINCQAPCDPHVDFPEPGACHDPSIEQGEPGGSCNNFIGNVGCNDATQFTCISDTCIPCGQPGQVCCDHRVCNGNAGCVDDTDSHLRMCSTTCVNVGDPCCAGNECGNGMICDKDTQQCIAPPSVECNGGPDVFVFNIRNKDTHCGETLTASGTSAEAAKACFQEQVTKINHEFVADNQTLLAFEACNSESGFGPDQSVTVMAFSEKESLECAHSLCTNCASTVPGPCPP